MPMLRCKEITELATDYLEGDLAWHERLGVRLHLWMCANCRRYVDQMRKVVAMLRLLPAEAAPAELFDALLPHLREMRDKPA